MTGAVYKTKQKDTVLECIRNNKNKHITAEEIFELLRNGTTPVGKTTVYRCLNRLEEEGIVRKYTTGDNMPACYQYIEDEQQCCHHYHLKCSKCGTLFHMECDVFEELQKHIFTEHQFKIDNSKTVLYGLCKDCQ